MTHTSPGPSSRPSSAASPAAATPRLAMLLLTVFLPFAGGYYVSYLFRTINALLAPELVREFGIAPSDLGMLTSAYFITFGAVQLPLGILLDWFGPRRVNAGLLLVAAAGAAVFAMADGLPGLLLGRALIGVGVSACLMASIKAFTLWFPMNMLSRLNGGVLFAGSLGALTASAPLEAALRIAPWQHVMLGVCVMTLVMAALLMLVTPERGGGAQGQTLKSQLAGIGLVLRSMPFWKIAASGVPAQATFMAVQGLWLAAWLRDVAGMDKVAVGQGMLMQAVGMGVGALATGHFAEVMRRRGMDSIWLLRVGVISAMSVFGLMTAGVNVGVPVMVVVLALGASTSTLAYALVSRVVPVELAGRVNTTLNLLVFVLAFAAQWGMGLVIGQWAATPGHYALEGYRAAFGVFLAVQVVSFLWSLIPAKTAPA